MDLRGGNGNGEKWSECGFVLKAGPVGFAGRLGMECNRKSGSNGDHEVFGLNNRKDGVTIY